MSEKRKRQESQADSQPHKKSKHGFRVGPANLPDSTYKRHNDKIKKGLIERAQIKKQYAKVKRQYDAQEDEKQRQHQTTASEVAPDGLAEDADSPKNPSPASTVPHPDRVDLMSAPVANSEDDQAGSVGPNEARRRRKPRPNAFVRESQEAQRRKAEAEERRAAREEADRQRQEKLADRERFRKAMAKARTADGQRKLGRESNVLLEKVKRMVGGSQK